MSTSQPERISTSKGSASVQGYHKRLDYGERIEINERILLMAEAEYERQFGTSQTITRLRERGGLGMGEVLKLLAEALLRYAPSEKLIPRSLDNDVSPMAAALRRSAS